jgi:hypothetical protein
VIPDDDADLGRALQTIGEWGEPETIPALDELAPTLPTYVDTRPSRRRWWIAAAVAAVLLIAVAGFGLAKSSDGSSPYVGTGNVDAHTVEDWVNALSSSTPEEVERAVDVSSPGSPAFLYASYRVAYTTAGRDYGFGMADDDTEVASNEDGTFSWCVSGESQQACYMVDDIEVDAAGKLVTVSIDGEPLADRIVSAGQPVEMPGGGTAQVLYGYESIDGAFLWAVVEFQAGDADLRIPYQEASYVAADGSQIAHDPHKRIDPPPGFDLVAGEKRVAVYAFSEATMQGRIVFKNVCDSHSRTCTDVAPSVR